MSNATGQEGMPVDNVPETIHELVEGGLAYSFEGSCAVLQYVFSPRLVFFLLLIYIPSVSFPPILN